MVDSLLVIDPERQRFLSKPEVVALLHLHPGMTVAEIGAGHGSVSLAIARPVGPTGRILAVENAPDMLARFRRKPDYPANIELIASPYHQTTIASGCCDRILLANLWTELVDPAAVLAECRRLLRAGGRMLLIEWRAESRFPPGPPASRRTSLEEMVQILETHAWDVHAQGGAGPYSYYLEISPSEESV
jgi:ubiquinone/menaquinone biosynthesis C-methylase UbiE